MSDNNNKRTLAIQIKFERPWSATTSILGATDRKLETSNTEKENIFSPSTIFYHLKLYNFPIL